MQICADTVQSRFRDITFSDNLQFSGYFSTDHYSIDYMKQKPIYSVILYNLMTVFVETKSVNRSRVDCNLNHRV